MKITKKQFLAYERVRKGGKFNMVMDSKKAARESGLDLDTYFEIIKNYGKLHDKYMGSKFPELEKKLAGVGSIFKNRNDARFDFETLVEREDGRLSCGLKVWSDGKKLDEEDLQIIRANLELQGFSEIDHVFASKDDGTTDETEVTFYSFFEKPKKLKRATIEPSQIKTLDEIYHAILGVLSEEGPDKFDHFYKGNLVNDFAGILKHLDGEVR